MNLQVRRTKNEDGYEIIVTKNNKLIWVSGYFFYKKEEAIEFASNCLKQVMDDYKRYISCQIKEEKK